MLGTMRSKLIIFSSPLLYQDLRFFKSGKDLLVQKLVPQLAVKGFYIPILPETPEFLSSTCYRDTRKLGLLVNSRYNIYGGNLERHDNKVLQGA